MFLENGKGGIFQSGTFQIDPNATPEQLARKRALMTAMMPQFGRARYVGEGVGQALTGLAMGLKGRQLDKFEAQKRKEATDSLAGLTIGAGAYGAQQPSYSPFVPREVKPQTEAEQIAGDAMSAIGKDPASLIRAGLIDRGLPEHVADGFLMNFKDESGLKTDINEQAPIVPGSLGGYGLAQWTGPRRKQLEAFAAARGKPVSDMDTQLDFLMTELQGPESRAARKIFSTKDSGAAAAAIVNDFLRPAEEHRARRVAAYTGGGGSVPVGQGVPTGPSVTDLQAALANPWLTQPQRQQIQGMIDTQQAYRNSMQERAWRREDADYERQLAQQDPMYQLKLKQAQLNYDQDKAGVGGVSGAFGNLDAQAKAAGLQPGTPEYQQFMLNSGGAPATFRALDMQAQAAGFEPGTPEYAEFMATRGAGLQAGAKTTATNEANIANGGEAERVKAAGAAQGKQDVENRSELAEMERNMPSLLVVVDELNKLAGEATYTKAGQLRDWWFKETGQEPTGAAVARAKYIAMVDNQVLPLLRQTFGAQFTAQEGESLKKTLGDPDKTPAEKRAVLDAFIAQKQRDLQARYRQSGMVPVETPPPPPAGMAKTFEEFSADPSAKAAAEKYGVTLEEMWNIKQGGR